MNAIELRPLSLGELLDRAFLLYRRNFWLFAGIMLIPACVIIPIQFFVLRAQGVPLPWNKPPAQPHFPVSSFAAIFVYWILYSVAQAAVTYAVADAYLGRRSTIGEAYAKVRGHVWRVIGVSLQVGIRVFGLIFLPILVAAFVGAGLVAVIPAGSAAPRTLAIVFIVVLAIGGFAGAIWLAMRYSIALPATLLEDITGRAAIRRSVQLTRGRRGQIFVAVLLGLVVVYAVTALVQGPFYAGIMLMGATGHLPNWLILGMSVSSSLGGALAGPLMMIILVLFYYDLRIRKEGFDLQHMITSLPQPNPPDAAPATSA